MDSSAQGPGGKQLGDYLVAGEVARGGQGVVLDARHAASGRRVALKLLIDPEPAAVRRFRQEAKILATFCHPNLLRVTDLGEWQGRPYMAMEFVEGETLQARVVRGGPPPLEWSGRVLATVAHALEHCHARGVVHRDLKPANVLIEAGSERPVLVDFGLVKRDPEQLGLSSIDEGGKLSKTGELRGTPQYMAPEQASPARFGEVDARTDVYALGATLFFLLTTRPPFEGSSLVSLVKQVIGEPPPDPARERPGVPAELVRLCRRCLAKDRAERPASARAFAEELTALLGLDDAPSFASAAPATPRPAPALREPPAGCPRQLGPYQVEGLLGSGGMGSVLRARHEVLGVIRAVKVLDVGAAGPRAGARFAREVDHLARLRHANVVAIHDAGQVGRWSYYAMDLLEGEALDVLLERGPVECEQALRLARGIARGVGALHAAGVVHRDLKPQNVVLRAEDGQPVVIDLGLAIAPDLDQRLTKTGALVGTPFYMAPEQVRGARPDPRSDVYALGLILWELVTGRRGVGGGDTPHEVLARILSDEIPAPSSVTGGLPLELDRLCIRMLAKDPARRPADAGEVARELTGLLRERSPARRRPRAALALASAAALAAAALGGLALAGGARPPTDGGGAPTLQPPEPVTPTRPGEVARPLSPAELEEASRRLRALRREGQPEPRFRGLSEWLDEFAAHPDAAEVRALREEAGARFAHRTWPLEWGGLFVGPERFVTWNRAGEVRERALHGEARVRWTIDTSAQRVALTADRRELLVVGERSLERRAVADGAPLGAPWPHELDRVTVIATSPVAPLIALGGIRGGDKVVELRSLEDGALLGELWRGSTAPVAIAFDPTGRRVAVGVGQELELALRATGELENAARILPARGGEARELALTGRPNAVAFSPDGELLAVGESTGRLVLAEAATGARIRDLRAEGGTLGGFGGAGMRGSIKTITFLAGGRRLLSVQGDAEVKDGEVAVWDVASGERIYYRAGMPPCYAADLAPDGRWLLITHGEGIELWSGIPQALVRAE